MTPVYLWAEIEQSKYTCLAFSQPWFYPQHHVYFLSTARSNLWVQQVVDQKSNKKKKIKGKNSKGSKSKNKRPSMKPD